MYYLAFDISKAKVDGVLTNLKNKEEYFRVDNNQDALLHWLEKTTLPKKNRLVVGAESTGNYHKALMRTFVRLGYRFRLINPILTNQFIKTTIRKKKTDRTDSLIIAKLLSQGEGREIAQEEIATDALCAKEAQRVWGKMIEERSRLRKVRRNLTEYGEGSLALKTIASLENTVSESLSSYEKELQKLYGNREDVMLLQSIPGIGFTLAFIIATEIGSIDRIGNASKLVALAGMDPKIRQSGHCLNSTGRITKRGSTRLRYAFFLGANIARMHDTELKAHYKKKIAEGKRHVAATCSVSRKLIHRIYAVLSRRTAYVKH